MIRQFAVRTFTLAAVAGWLLAAPHSAAAQANNFGALRGHVVDATGKPVPDAEVQFDFVGNIQQSFKTKTNATGDFTQAGLPVGKWNIKITKGDLSAKLIGQTVIGNDQVRIRPDFVMRSSGGKGSGVPTDLSAGNASGKTDAATEKLIAEIQNKFKAAVEALNADKPDDAIPLLTDVAKISEKCATCRAKLGEAYLKKGIKETDADAKKAAFASAEEAFNKGIEIDPAQPDSYAGLASLYNTQQKFDDATKMSNKAMELMAAAPGGGDPAVIYNQGVIFWNQGKVAEAKTMFAKVVELDPKNSDAHFYYGMALVNEGKLPDAKKELEEYLKLAPTGDNAATAKAILAQIK